MCHVLVIEDEWLIAEHVGDLAERAGASTIDYASTEAEAIAAARRAAPRIILSDVRLAEGTGPRAAEAIRRECGPVPTIFITGSPEQCVQCDYAAAILGKPIVDHVVIDAVRRFASARP